MLVSLFLLLQTFSNILGLEAPLTPNQLKLAIYKVSTTTHSASEKSDDDENKRAQVLLDSICISLVTLLLQDLQVVLGFPYDKLNDSSREALSDYFGVNELTWPELARQCIIMHLLQENFSMSSEILGFIRGTSLNVESTGNNVDRTTVELLRQRIECQNSSLSDSGDNRIAVPPELDGTLCKLLDRDCQDHHNISNIESEEEEEDSVNDDTDHYNSSVCDIPEFNEKCILRKLLNFINGMKDIVRRRCSIVLWWLFEKGAGHHFWSEPEDNSQYYDVITHPMCLHTVFCKVVRSASNGGYDDETLRKRFIRDIQLILENALCFEGDGIFDSKFTLDLCWIFQRLVWEWLPFEDISTSSSSTTTGLPPPSQEDGNYDVVKVAPKTVLLQSIETSTNSEMTTDDVRLSTLSPTVHPMTFTDCSSPHSSSLIGQQPDGQVTISEESAVNSNNWVQQQFTDVDAAALLAAPFMYMCSECHGGAESDPSVFCSRCEARYHLKCLTPPLEGVPSSTWFCHICEKGVIWGWASGAYGGQVRHNDLLGRPADHPMELLCGSGQDGRLSRGECREGDVGMGGLTQWGLFSGIPRYLDWTLNAKVGRLLSVEGETRVLLDALRLLSSRDGGFFPSPSAWTPGERIVVMLSLCHAGLRSQPLNKYLSNAETRCNALRHSIISKNQKNIGQSSNAKSSFLKLLKDVGGEQVILFWERMLLSDMNDVLSEGAKEEECGEPSGNSSSSSSKDFCLLCWQNTLLRKTVACSVCRGVVHLSCAMSKNALLESTPFCCSHCRPSKATKPSQYSTGSTDSFRFLEDPAFLQDRLNREKVFTEAAIDFVMRQRSATGPNLKQSGSSKCCGKCSACRARNCRKCSFCKVSSGTMMMITTDV